MLFNFSVGAGVGYVLKGMVEKQNLTKKQKKKIKKVIARLRGGGFALMYDNDLVHTILCCILDEQRYLMTDPKLRQLIFNLVKTKITNESLRLSPNMIRVLALNLISKNQSLITRIGNVVVSTNNRAQLFARVVGSFLIGVTGFVFSVIPYAFLATLLYHNSTVCGYPCQDYFDTVLESSGPIRIFSEESTGHLTIIDNNEARQVEIDTRSKIPDQVTVSDKGDIQKTTTYTKSRRKAKEVKFSDFKRIDPVLSAFNDLEEPDVPTKKSADLHDVIAIRID